jgi:hypothetical protein
MSKSSYRLIYHQIYLQNHPEILEIPEGYVIHHKDFNHDNNNPENLEMLTRAEHNKIHRAFDKSSWNIGKKHTEETKKKLSEAAKGRKHTEETKKKLSEAKTGIPNPKMQGEKHPNYGKESYMKGKYHSEESKIKIGLAHIGKEPPNKIKITEEMVEHVKQNRSIKKFKEDFGFGQKVYDRIKNNYLKLQSEFSEAIDV